MTEDEKITETVRRAVFKSALEEYYKKARLLTTKERVKLYVSMGIAKMPVLECDRIEIRKELFEGVKGKLIPSQRELGR